MTSLLDVLKLKEVLFMSPFVQVVLICGLFCLAVLTQRQEYKKTGKTYGHYPWRISTFLSSTYEEIIFRGFILFWLLEFLPIILSVIISSVLFGLFHIKNNKWQTKQETFYQVFYAGIIFGPFACILTLWLGTIWPVVIFHYVHNFIANEFNRLWWKSQGS